MKKKRASWRPSPKQDYVLNEMRSRIVGGQYPPGSRLPLRRELEKEFDVSWLTIQRAFDRLRRDGVVKPRGRAGTFVVDYPPHVCHYAMVSARSAAVAPWLTRAAAELQKTRPEEPPCRISLYCREGADRPESSFDRLVEDIEAHRLAGVVFRGEIEPWKDTPLVTEAKLPKVLLADPVVDLGVPKVCPDWQSFVDRAFDHLASRGARRVAVLATTFFRVPLADIMEGIRRRGMETHPHWVQYVGGDDSFINSPDSSVSIRHLTQLLVGAEADRRPDALVVVDDNMLADVAEGVKAADLSEDALHVVSHYSHPFPVACDIPVKRLGFDTLKLVRTALDRIDMLRCGETAPPRTTIPALFEDEMV